VLEKSPDFLHGFDAAIRQITLAALFSIKTAFRYGVLSLLSTARVNAAYILT